MIDKFVVIRWLLANTVVLRELSDIVADWATKTSLAERLEIVYLAAKAIVPIIETFPLFQSQALPVTLEEQEEQLVYAQSLGIAVPLLVNVIAPLVVTFIRYLISSEEE